MRVCTTEEFYWGTEGKACKLKGQEEIQGNGDVVSDILMSMHLQR